ncbi:ATPases involved in pili biogenesis, putative [Shewanella piezotolerans WP3]|uniref:ATPases involved in pili biogenesis, putative n=1 Tax=Shewanella piezotolerans (strain WP3 / JCM 13877) TaxID=225849 RepID=B8CN65_SHEPW|nr:DUF748 domain-containing protein [Shewanella piezotolerans]ACJ28567.1 ATPases involved in pili biogenesis, putative [Shewanella piezotolerans WP3]
MLCNAFVTTKGFYPLGYGLAKMKYSFIKEEVKVSMTIVPKSLVGFRDKFRQLPRYLRLLTLAATLYLVFTAILGLLIPYIAVKQVPQQLSNLLQRPVILNDIRINPFTFEMTIDQFQIQESKTTLNSDEFVEFEQLTFEYRFWHSIFNTAFSIADVTLLNPSLNVERLKTDNSLTFNFSDILDTLAKNSSQPEGTSEPATGLPHFMVENLAIVDANLSFIDNITEGKLRYPQVNLNIKSFDSKNALSMSMQSKQEEQSNQYAIHFVGNNGGEISTQGVVQLEPLSIVGDIQLTDIQLPQFWSFIDKQFIANLASGRLSVDSQYRLEEKNDYFQVTTNEGLIKFEDLTLIDDKITVASLPIFAIEGIEFDLNHQSISADKISSQGLVVNTTLNQKGSNLEKLFEPKLATTAEPKQQQDDVVDNADKEAQSLPWTAVLNGVDIENYQVNLTEKIITQETLWRISDVKLHTGKINADLSSPIDYQLSLNINQQGSLSADGSIDIKQQNVLSQIQLSNLGLNQFQDYLSPYINIDLKQGLLSTEGNLELNNEADQVSYNGALNISHLLVKDTVQKKTLLKWKNVDINAIGFDKAANSVEIDHIMLEQPYGRIIIAEDKSTNFGELMVSPPATELSLPTEQNTQTATTVKVTKPTTDNNNQVAAAMAISINKISIQEGSTFFADNSLTPNFAASIEQLNGQITQLSSSSKKAASVDIQGKIDRYAPVTLKGDINPLLEQPFLDLALAFKHVELTSVNPYSGTYAGYYIDKGQLSLALNYRLENNQLVGDNHLVVDQLELGKPSDSSLATTLPVTLAIALLQDRHGVIDLGLQVSGDLDEPSFSFGSIVMTAFTNVITKAVTAPFSLLANLLGADDDELDKVNFSAGSSQLSDKAQETLGQLAKGLADRPMLMLNVEGAVNVADDNRALSEVQLSQKLAQLAQLEPEQLPTGLTASTYPTSGPLSDALKLLYETELASPAIDVKTAIEAEHQGDNALTDEELATRWHIALYNFSLSAQRISDDALGNLAQQRAAAVKTFLANNKTVAPERVFLLDSRVNLNTGASQALLTLTAN